MTIAHGGMVAGGAEGGGAAEETTSHLTRMGHPDKIIEYETAKRVHEGVARIASVVPYFKGCERVGERSGVTEPGASLILMM
jgi:hypothetical protein